jgi:septal ring factor EnvC (AmiA/AmiB activator)
MKVLSDAQMKRRDELVDDLRSAKKAISEQQNLVNQVIGNLNEEIETYNSLLEQAKELRNEVAKAIEEDWQDKEEDWFTSREGEEQTSWKDEWEQSYTDRVETVPECELETLDQDKELEQLPESQP